MKILEVKEFIKRNAFLLLIAGFMLLLIFIMIFSRPNTTVTIPEDAVLATNDQMSFYREAGKYYVRVGSININNKDSIRATLGIPSEIDFEIVVPGMLMHENWKTMTTPAIIDPNVPTEPSFKD